MKKRTAGSSMMDTHLSLLTLGPNVQEDGLKDALRGLTTGKPEYRRSGLLTATVATTPVKRWFSAKEWSMTYLIMKANGGTSVY